MAYGKRKYSKKGRKPYRKKRSFKKRRTRRGPTTRNIGNAIPDRIITKMRYVEQNLTLATSTLGLATYTFNVNNLFDPNYTGTGHQPLLFDQWAALYAKYRVKSCLAVLTPMIFGNTSEAMMIGMVASNESSGPTNIQLLQEQPGLNKCQLLTYNNQGMNQRSMVLKINMAKITGQPYKEFCGDDTTAGPYNGAPSERVYLHVYSQNITNSTSVWDIKFNIKLYFNCEWFDRFNITGS